MEVPRTVFVKAADSLEPVITETIFGLMSPPKLESTK